MTEINGVDAFHQFSKNRLAEDLAPQKPKKIKKSAMKAAKRKASAEQNTFTHNDEPLLDEAESFKDDIDKAHDQNEMIEKEGLITHIMTYQQDERFGKLIKDRGHNHKLEQLRKMSVNKLGEVLAQIKYAVGTRQNTKFVEDNVLGIVKLGEKALHSRYRIDGLAQVLKHDQEWNDTLHECLLLSGVYYVDPRIRLAMHTLQSAVFVHAGHAAQRAALPVEMEAPVTFQPARVTQPVKTPYDEYDFGPKTEQKTKPAHARPDNLHVPERPADPVQQEPIVLSAQAVDQLSRVLPAIRSSDHPLSTYKPPEKPVFMADAVLPAGFMSQ